MKQEQFPKRTAQRILVVDVGGTHVKLLVTGQKEPIEILSGPTLTAKAMVQKVKAALKDRPYDVVSLGYPGPVVHEHPLREPYNLGRGWVRFDFRKAFGRPVKIINDAAMQALGSYKGGRMLFLGLGTGLGSAMIVDGVLQPMELAHLPYKGGKTYEEYLGIQGLKRQNPQAAQDTVAKELGIAKEDVICHVTLLGGGFGRKSKPDYVAEAAVLSKKLARPVKVVWTREDDIKFDYYNAVASMYIKAALGTNGKPTAWLQRSVFPPIPSIFDVNAVYGDAAPSSAGLDGYSLRSAEPPRREWARESPCAHRLVTLGGEYLSRLWYSMLHG